MQQLRRAVLSSEVAAVVLHHVGWAVVLSEREVVGSPQYGSG
jgi:hypothetical protein